MDVCEIIGPSGQIRDESIRAGLLFQDANVLYPRHSHAAEEIYFPLSGQAAWQTDDDDWRLHAPGDVIHHLPFSTTCNQNQDNAAFGLLGMGWRH